MPISALASVITNSVLVADLRAIADSLEPNANCELHGPRIADGRDLIERRCWTCRICASAEVANPCQVVAPIRQVERFGNALGTKRRPDAKRAAHPHPETEEVASDSRISR